MPPEIATDMPNWSPAAASTAVSLSDGARLTNVGLAVSVGCGSVGLYDGCGVGLTVGSGIGDLVGQYEGARRNGAEVGT